MRARRAQLQRATRCQRRLRQLQIDQGRIHRLVYSHVDDLHHYVALCSSR